jgi:ribonuclease P protein component
MSDEAHFSAKQPGPRTAARVSVKNGDSRRSGSDSVTPGTRSQKTVRLTTIHKRADFLAANAARRFATPGFVLLVRPRGDASPAARLGITVTKKIGGAVVRNRMKRRFRALAQSVIAPLARPGDDHILIGRAGGVERDYDRLHAELSAAIQKILAPKPSDKPKK